MRITPTALLYILCDYNLCFSRASHHSLIYKSRTIMLISCRTMSIQWFFSIKKQGQFTSRYQEKFIKKKNNLISTPLKGHSYNNQHEGTAGQLWWVSMFPLLFVTQSCPASFLQLIKVRNTLFALAVDTQSNFSATDII